MGILPTPQATEQKPTSSKRKSRQIDFASLGPLEAKGTVGFAGYRDSSGASPSMKNGVKKDPDEMDSDADDDEGRPNGGVNIKDEAEDETAMEALSAEEFARRAELAEGVKKMQVCWNYNSPFLFQLTYLCPSSNVSTPLTILPLEPLANTSLWTKQTTVSATSPVV